MGEARRDSSSSLQHKKPPWLKLDIPAVVPPAAEEPSFLQEPRRPVLQRQMSITQTIRRGTADWFGVSKDSDSTQKWQRKSIRHCSQRYGKLKPQVIRELDLPSQDNVSLTSTETPPPLYVGPCQLGMQKLPLRFQPAPAAAQARVGGQDELPGSCCAGEGSLG